MGNAIDDARIAELRAVLGDSLIDVLRDFQRTAPIHMEALAQPASDPALLIPSLHALGGSAANIGLHRLGAECRRLEEALRAHGAVDLPQAQQSIRAAYADSVMALESLLRD